MSIPRLPMIALLLIYLGCNAVLLPSRARAELTIDAGTLRAPPPGVRIGKDIDVVTADSHSALHFQNDAIEVPLKSVLTAASGTVRVRFQVPKNWPTPTRDTLFHIGQQAHVHVTLFATHGRFVAVYKGGKQYYAAINYPQSAEWKPGSWHALDFCWQAKSAADRSVVFFLEADGRLVGNQAGRTISEWPKLGYIGARRHGQAWRGLVDHITLSNTFTLPRELRPGRRTIIVNGDQTEGTCYNFWSVANYTTQHMWADPGYAARVRIEKPFMHYVNCVRLLGGRHDGRNRWFQGVAKDGHIKTDFSGMIWYLRGMQNAGYTPRIVLDNIPTAMSVSGELATYGNTRPAKDLKVWHAYVRQAVRAMVDAFGLQTVVQWRFRVGTEPDLNPGHWQGTKEDYFRHYDCTVDAVCSVIPNAEIGPGNILNPANTEAAKMRGRNQWGLDIVDHCAVGTNTWTGQTGTRMCFLECSWYGRVGRSIDSFDVAVRRMRDRLRRYPRFAGLPISIAEFAILQDEYNRRLYNGDITEWGASWYAAIAQRVYTLDVRQVHEWAETTHGVPHPRTLVIGMLERMQGGRRLHVTVRAQSAARAGAIACVKNNKYYILLYNHRPWRNPPVAEHIDLTLEAQRLQEPGRWAISQWAIDKEHGVFAHRLYADCAAAGLEPLPDAPLYGGKLTLRFGPAVRKLFAENRPEYARLARPVRLQRDVPLTISAGAAKVTVDMPGHGVRLLVIARDSAR